MVFLSEIKEQVINNLQRVKQELKDDFMSFDEVSIQHIKRGDVVEIWQYRGNGKTRLLTAITYCTGEESMTIENSVSGTEEASQEMTCTADNEILQLWYDILSVINEEEEKLEREKQYNRREYGYYGII